MPHNDSQRANRRISTSWWISNGTSIVLKKTSTAVGNKAWFTPLRNIEFRFQNMSDLVVPQLDSPFEPGKDAYNTSWLKLSFHTILLWPERNQKDEGAGNVAPKISLENHLEKSHTQSSQNQRHGINRPTPVPHSFCHHFIGCSSNGRPGGGTVAPLKKPFQPSD